MDNNTHLIGAYGTIDEQDGQLVRVRAQDIGDDFIKGLEIAKTSRQPFSDYMQVCDIPQVLVDTWLARGFDIHQHNAREICDRLRTEGYADFITGS